MKLLNASLLALFLLSYLASLWARLRVSSARGTGVH